MLPAAREIREFTEGAAWEQFESNRMMQHAVVRLIPIIGEASRKISPEFQQAHDEIAWQEIVGEIGSSTSTSEFLRPRSGKVSSKTCQR
jgi:uncharacterized protein with HEPN domain